MKELYLAQSWYYFLLMAVVCYFIGCFNFAMLIARLKHKDVRKIGSGNPGTMNMSREFGLKVGFVNFVLDAFKGGVPAVIGYLIFRGYVFEGTQVLVSDFVRYLCGLCVVVGHVYPVTMRFRGGKGIASTLGLFWLCLGCENPWYFLIGFCCLWLIVLYIGVTEWGSMGSLLGVSAFSIWQGVEFFLRYSDTLSNGYVICLFLFLLAFNLLTWFAHRHNLVRLFAGEEHRTSIRKLSKGKRGTQNM